MIYLPSKQKQSTPGNIQKVLCGIKRKDLNKNININHPSMHRKLTFYLTCYIFVQIFTLLSSTAHYFEYFQGEVSEHLLSDRIDDE